MSSVARTMPAARAGTSAIDRDRLNRQIAAAAACVGVALLGLRQDVVNGVSVGLLFCLLAAPLWTRNLREYRGARILLAAGLATVGGGLVLMNLGSAGHRYSPANAVADVGYVATIVVGAAFVLWARRVVPVGTILIAFGTGLLLSVNTHYALFPSNPWKFGFSVPMTVIALGVVQLRPNRAVVLATVLFFSALLVVSDARSGLAILAIVAILLVYQARPWARPGKGSAATFVILGVGLAIAVYRLVEFLILQGLFGEETRARTIAQLASAGSLLLGGRPELGASAALLLDHPIGYGPGVKPTIGDLHTAQAGMAHLGYNPDNGYVYHYMFGVTIELHSTAADLWARFGLVGLAFAALLAFVLIRGMAVGVVSGTVAAGMLYLAVQSLWNLAFSPIGGSYIVLAVALGLAVPLARPRKPRLPKESPA
jgi:hypothetical protein